MTPIVGPLDDACARDFRKQALVSQKGSTPISAQVMAMGGDATKLKAEAQALAKTVLEKL